MIMQDTKIPITRGRKLCKYCCATAMYVCSYTRTTIIDILSCRTNTEMKVYIMPILYIIYLHHSYSQRAIAMWYVETCVSQHLVTFLKTWLHAPYKCKANVFPLPSFMYFWILIKYSSITTWYLIKSISLIDILYMYIL